MGDFLLETRSVPLQSPVAPRPPTFVNSSRGGQSRNSVPRVTKLPDLTPPAGRHVPIFASEPLGPSELSSLPQSNATKPPHGRAGASDSPAVGSVVRQVFSSTRDAAASSITWR